MPNIVPRRGDTRWHLIARVLWCRREFDNLPIHPVGVMNEFHRMIVTWRFRSHLFQDVIHLPFMETIVELADILVKAQDGEPPHVGYQLGSV